MKKGVLFVLIFVVVSTLSLSLWYFKVEPFETFSLRFNDINFDLQHKEPYRDIVFVAIDEKSVNRFGRWPWKRSIVAQGIEKFHQADVVVTDMVFSEVTSDEEDEQLTQALEDTNSVCGFFLRHKATQQVSALQEDILEDSVLDRLQSSVAEYHTPQFVAADFAELNIVNILQSCTLSGTFSTLRESDHLFRAYPIAFYFKNLLYPSLGVQTLRLLLNSDITREDALHVKLSDFSIGVDKRGFVRLNYYQADQYNIVSFEDVYDTKIKAEYFENKIVILGITEVGASDVRATPMGAMYGPLLHYTFLSNVLANHLIIEPRNIGAIVILIMILLPFLIYRFQNEIVKRVSINLLAYLLLYGFIRYLFVTQMIYIDLFYPLLALMLSALVIEVTAFRLQENSGRFLKNAFSSYLSESLLEQLIKHPDALKLGGEKKRLSILFSDIRGFTSISENMDPEKLTSLLNRYFTPMTEAVLENNGMLDKYIGDAVMAFYNAPISLENHANAACNTALQMQDSLKKLNGELLSEGLPQINIGIGINTAEVVVGNMGSVHRFNYTIMGDGVNLASRIEGQTKIYSCMILITEMTYHEIDSSFLVREIEPVQVKGKQEKVLLYELMRRTPETQSLKMDYDKVMALYKASKFQEAYTQFHDLHVKYEDSVSLYFASRAKEYM
ncbi:MAG: adenylate/guanylate cyclase domain-containing protein [Campylobacterota bacterium]|nr:adenylate/guanylate cyclase domain-containing protein [Campylobacterota bacterium]